MLFVAVFLLSSDVDAMVMVRNEKKEMKKNRNLSRIKAIKEKLFLFCRTGSMLIARVWDAVNDPMMGAIMQLMVSLQNGKR